MKNTLPLAKSSDIVTQELRGEVLVYNLTNNKAMCLNPSVAFIWANCDGSNNVSDLMNLFQKEFKNKIGEDFILLSLDELNKFDLIENYSNNAANRISRRKVLLNYALPLALLPLVAGIVAPSAANAASGGNVCNTGLFGDVCSMDSDCNLFNSGINDPMNNCDELGAGLGISCTVECDIPSGCCTHALAA